MRHTYTRQHPSTMPRVSDKRLMMIKWFLKSIKVDMENQSLGEALEDFEDLDEVDDVFGLDSISSFDTDSSSSSWTSSSWPSWTSKSSTNHTTTSELVDKDLGQRMLLVMYLQSIRYLKPRGGDNTILKSLSFYENILPHNQNW